MQTKTPRPIPKVSAGIPALDEILHGGFPENRTTLIKGAAGTGKTVLGLEFLHHSAVNGAPAIFISFEETADVIRQNALSMGWDIPALESSGRFFLWDARIEPAAVTTGDFSIEPLLAAIRGKAEQMGARRIMIDAVDVLMRLFRDPDRERNEICRLHDWLTQRRFTTLLTQKIHKPSDDRPNYDFLEFMADCVLLLDLRVVDQTATRRLRATKYRGSGFYSNEYPYAILEEGNIILHVTGMMLLQKAPEEKFSSGNANLDAALGGGFYRSSCILISGPSGVGKTTLASTIAEAACARGEKVLYVSFEESEDAVVAHMRSAGVRLKQALEEGRLEFYTMLPETLSAEAHLFYILQRIDRFQSGLVVIDGASAASRMGSLSAAFDFVFLLIHSCRKRETVCLMTYQTEDGETVGATFASMTDVLIRLKYTEVDNQMQRSLMIIKARGARHSNRRQRFVITDEGVRIDSAPREKGGR